ncbi:MAG: hypothetical protein JNK93_07880 [Planctomycetia bacterium]|nr:hypothetical protein [Planctomycetia bacterium]
MRKRILIGALMAWLAPASLFAQDAPELSAQAPPATPMPRPQPMPRPGTPATPSGPTTPATPTPGTSRVLAGPTPPNFDLASTGTRGRSIELPNMYGDFQEVASLARGTASNTGILLNESNRVGAGRLPVPVIRGAYKISENEAPRPVDRVYLTYHYFYDVNPGQRQRFDLPITNVHRQTFGIEKTNLDGNASIGLRLPLLQLTGPTELDRATVGDLSIILKYAFINEPLEFDADGSLLGGRVLSGGLVVTAPTGGAAAFTVQNPVVHPTLLQPYIGGTTTFRRAYGQFISSIAVPTDDRDTTYLFNSVQVGYLLMNDLSGSRFVRSVTPIAELHVNVPFNNRDINRFPVGATDIVSFTVGTSFGLGSRSSLNLGVNAPVTGPRVYALETLVHLNVRY